MTTNPATHAFADQKYLAGRFFACLHESSTMGSDELRWRIGPPSALAHIIVVEQCHFADSFQALLPFLHPKMGRRRASSGRKEKTRFHRWKLSILLTPPTGFQLVLQACSPGNGACPPRSKPDRRAGSLSSISQRSF